MELLKLFIIAYLLNPYLWAIWLPSILIGLFVKITLNKITPKKD